MATLPMLKRKGNGEYSALFPESSGSQSMEESGTLTLSQPGHRKNCEARGPSFCKIIINFVIGKIRVVLKGL